MFEIIRKIHERRHDSIKNTEAEIKQYYFSKIRGRIYQIYFGEPEVRKPRKIIEHNPQKKMYILNFLC